MAIKSVVSYTAMLTAYAQNGQIGKARQVFDEMPERNIASWNAMITAYTRSGSAVGEARELFRVMPERNAVSYAAMITGFVLVGDMDKAEELYEEMPAVWRDPVSSNALISGFLKMGKLQEAIRVFEGMVEKDVVSWSSMVDGFCKHERIEEARYLFDKMPERNVVTWTAMINGYMKSGNFDNGLNLFMDMRREEGIQVNSTTLTVIFEACGDDNRPKEAHQVHGIVFRMGFNFDVFLGNSIINLYCRFGSVDLASLVFRSMISRDIVSWNSLICGYVQAQDIEEAYSLFEKMPMKDSISWTAIITGFFDRGLIENSIKLFNLMPNKDNIAWTAVITGFVSNEEYDKAFRWFIKMLRTSIRPNPLTLSSMLSASSGLATLNQGLQIHAHVFKMILESDLSVQNSLVSMYSKCGHLEDASRVFESINYLNIISYNSMITAYAQNGLGKEAIILYEKMQKGGEKPNEITFLGVLSACVHMGFVDEGWSYFNSMRSSNNLQPGVDHYACIVDLLGRSGFLDEAMNLINSMPFEPHSGVWGALLGASRTYLRLDIGKLAAQKLIELEPNDATPYVVLCDIYQLTGKEKEGEGVRTRKKLKGVKKSPGCSWIVVKDEVNVFSAGDQSHICFEQINKMLLTIMYEVEQVNSQIN